ncbi:MAG TPA: DHH family phosphoesterase [Bacilli bacterium]|jgi:c-di-AMP phosphodiesterase-like protein|nr:DHH family phosphoesterase [Bacilli bacterium]HOR20991.1 DHH family phosphoesterase [Bacilli bacterium]HPK67829.1 DHH family phosphoesterase [Bacilli bacterium]HPV69825.1 DHH family phosphoesterase [Bacilli bacterium]
MTKELRKMKIRALFIVALELISAAALAVFYFYDFFNFRDIYIIEYLFATLAGFVVINVLFIWVMLVRLSKIRKKSDLKAAELIGNDVQEAYKFGMIGLVVVDENDIVLWTNDLFQERQIDLLDINILEWQPNLRELHDASPDVVVKIEVNSRNYDVKYLSDAGLYIFKDMTEYESIFEYSREQAPVLGIIMLDNYSDVAGNLDDANDVISKVKNLIFDYAKEYGVLLRRYRNDAYFALCNYSSLNRMKKDRFSLLEKVRELGAKEETPPTLSIGLAHDFPDVVKLNEMAGNAIDIAMSRGGDQVVVSKYGDELIFFGGKSEAQEKRNKVKVRVMADSVLSLIKNSSNVIIMGHTAMDMDALGACLGMRAICEYCNKSSHIVYDPKLLERKTKFALTGAFSREELARITISPSDSVDKVRSNTLVIVCDVHRPSLTMAPKLLEKATKVMVIDHHRRAEEFIESPVFSYVEPSASSTCELVTELIRYSSANPRIEISPTYATIMLSGIFLDTTYFKSKNTGIRTFEASMVLKEYGADNSVADDYLKDEFEEYSLVTKIISTLKTPHYGVVYCVAEESELIEISTLAKVANQCMQMKGVNAAFVIGNTDEKETRISARSDGTINVQMLAEKMFGGGHFTMAGVSFKNGTIKKAEEKLLEVLNEYLNDARSQEQKARA